MDNKMKSIMHLSSGHMAKDNRIFYSELFTLINNGYRCYVVGINSKSFEKFHNIHIISVYQTGARRPSQLINAISNFLIAVKTKHCIYHFHDPILMPFCIILKLIGGKRIIYDIHDDYEASILDRFLHKPFLGRLISKLWWFFEKNISSVFDGIVVADRHLATKFQSMNPVSLGNYPRLDFTEAADISLEKTFNLIYVGRVNWERGVSKILDALDLIPHKDIRFHIIGECKDKTLLERIRSNERVIWHGRVAWTELHKYYTRSHLGLAVYQSIPSFQYSPGENSVKIIEYMAAGIPVICSNFSGLKTFVENAGYGLTVAPDNPEDISEKINFLYNHPELRKQLGQNGRNAFEMKYNWEHHEGKLIDLYERIL